jgi:XTP/dITP diphosphohydrolase
MIDRLVLASGNRAKAAEFRRILREDPALAGVTLLDATDVDLPEVVETGTTFRDNALLKARSAAAASGLPAVADDSGLVVDALGGEPGIYSARYAGRHGDDAANTALVLERMRGRTDRAARFVCAAALVAPDGREWVAEAALEGTLVEVPRGTNGFGYDPVLQPLGETRTTAEMTPGEKDAISHRGQALRRLRPAVAAL